jgi:hypothetical protein
VSGDVTSLFGLSGGVATVPVVVSIDTPGVNAGDTNTDFSFQANFANGQSCNLTSSKVVLSSTGTVACSNVTVANGTTSAPTVTIGQCAGTGTFSFSITAGVCTDNKGNSDSGSSASQTVTVINCPGGYTLVPPLVPNTSQYICAMKYEAKNDGSGNAISQADTIPWVNTNRNQAITLCQNLGSGYDLITNDEWLAIARNIEQQSVNWSGGAVGSGCIFEGNNGQVDACGYGAGAWYDFGSGRDTKAQLTLSNGKTIWDLSANAFEWIKDDVSFAYTAAATLIGTMTDTTGFQGPLGYPKAAFGPLGDYTSHDATTNYAGLGRGWMTQSTGVGVRKGGAYDLGSYSGIFATALNQSTTVAVGTASFRCVYHPTY